MRSRTRTWSIVVVVGTSLFVLSLILALAVFPYLVETKVAQVSGSSNLFVVFTRGHVRTKVHYRLCQRELSEEGAPNSSEVFLGHFDTFRSKTI